MWVPSVRTVTVMAWCSPLSTQPRRPPGVPVVESPAHTQALFGMRVDPDPVAEAVDAQPRQSADAAGTVGPGRLETGEVVGAAQHLGGPRHRLRIELPPGMAAVASHKEVRYQSIVDDVAIELAF